MKTPHRERPPSPHQGAPASDGLPGLFAVRFNLAQLVAYRSTGPVLTELLRGRPAGRGYLTRVLTWRRKVVQVERGKLLDWMTQGRISMAGKKARGHVSLVVDRSGSMHETMKDAEGGIKKFIEDQRELKNTAITISLYDFDTYFRKIYGPVKASEAPEYSLWPRGNTALYDAVALAIEGTMLDIENMAKSRRPSKVVICVVTDGCENSSRRFTFEQVTKLVAERKEAGWEFLFLAGTLEAVRFGKSSGLRTMGYDPTRQMGQTYSVAAAATADYMEDPNPSRGIQVPDVLPDDEAD